MPSRHLSRIIAMQSLFEWDFDKNKSPNEIMERNASVFGEERIDKEYTKTIINGVIEKLYEIDKKIQEAAQERPLEQISVLDKTILRIATFEILFKEDIPPKVAINEAVEIAKTFGGENSSSFVNGVLGTIYRKSPRYVVDEKEIEREIKKRWENLIQKIKESQK